MATFYYYTKYKHLCNCVYIATIDGLLNNDSVDIILKIVERLELTVYDFEKACRLLKKKKLKLTIWDDYVISNIGNKKRFDGFVEDYLLTAYASGGTMSPKMNAIYHILQNMVTKEIIITRTIQKLIENQTHPFIPKISKAENTDF